MEVAAHQSAVAPSRVHASTTDVGQDENLGVEITGGGGREVVWANAGDTWAMGVGVWAVTGRLLGFKTTS
jgi:hypothetical protein